MENDLISRQDAIEALLKEANEESAFGYIDAKDAEMVLNSLSSAEPRWIPVTERLPKLGEKVLVSTKNTVFTQMFKRIYDTPDRWAWEHNTIKKVSAWMPLPEPWKGDKDAEIY